MFEGVSEEAEKGIRRLCEIAAFRVVYKDLREPLLEGLYVNGLAAKSSRLGALLEKLHPHLVTVADVINEKLRNRLVLQLLHALVHGYSRVLLAGGPRASHLVSTAPSPCLLGRPESSCRHLVSTVGILPPLKIAVRVLKPVWSSVDSTVTDPSLRAAPIVFCSGKQWPR